jgi:hypothetical protein
MYTEWTDLNIFPLRDFGSNVDRRRAKHLGRWSTRLCIVLFISGLAILALYTIVQPETLTKTFNKPPFNLYNQLSQDYGDKLKCSCSLIASTYDQFVKIKPVFHEVRRDYSSLLKMKECIVRHSFVAKFSKNIVDKEVHSLFLFLLLTTDLFKSVFFG